MPKGEPSDAFYAEALLALARAVGTPAGFVQELSDVLDVARHERWRRFAADPTVPPRAHVEALHTLLEGRVRTSLLYFLLILAAEGRLSRLPQIAEQFFQRAAALESRADGELICARPISEDYLEAITQEASRIVGQPVQLRVRVNPDLVGGFLLRVGRCVIDATLDQRFEAARQQLLG